MTAYIIRRLLLVTGAAGRRDRVDLRHAAVPHPDRALGPVRAGYPQE